MKRLFPVTLALAWVFVLAASSASAYIPDGKLGREYTSQRAFFLACVWSQYTCWGMTRPYVEYVDMSDKQGLLGLYKYGDDTIYINEEVRGTPLGFVVVIHETIHYLQFKSGASARALKLGKPGYCGLEEEAFNVGHLVTQVLGWDPDYYWRGWDLMRAFTYSCPQDPPNPTVE